LTENRKFNMFLRISLLLLFFCALPVAAQENLSFLTISDALKENANAVIRLDQTDITISARNSMTIKKARTVTILNELGMRYMDASEYYSKNTTIKNVEVLVYDAQGQQIKKIKRKEFKDQSLSEGSEILDGRMLYLDYTAVQYPFTIVYTSEVQTSNTAFIPQWSPLEGAYASTQKSVINITYPASLGFKYKDYNFGEVALNKLATATTLSLSAENVTAIRYEEYSPSLLKVRPHVLFGLEKFHLEGVDGEASTWEGLGTWMNNTLLAGTDELPVETQSKIKALVGNETDDLKKAKIVYKYVQGKTRYISIQLGIGGWKPMLAKDVDRLGYGDCKALSNYTRALLKVVGVNSYYTVIYGDRNRRDIREDFVSMQGNHIVLAIPYKNDLVWLECTSQIMPFGFQGDFTDNRMALIVKDGKGQMVRTHVYEGKGNTQIITGDYNITDNGAIAGALKIVSKGLQYDDKFSVENRSADDRDKIYKDRFRNINNLKFKKTNLTNDSDTQQFTEDLAIEAEGYCNKSGNRVIFAVNAFNQSFTIPQRYRSRKLPFEISTGFYDHDEVTINLPEGFTIEAKPENVTLTDKFGEYKAEYEMVAPTKMLYKRTLTINEGYYASNEYENYRLFRENIARNDNAKVVLVKK